MKTWEWKATWILVALVAVMWLAVQASQPCTLSFVAHKGFNFGQPYPVYQHGVQGDQCTQITDIHGNSLTR